MTPSSRPSRADGDSTAASHPEFGNFGDRLDAQRNDAFSPQIALDAIAPALRTFLVNTSRTSLALSPDDLDAIGEARAAVLARVEETFDVMAHLAQERRRNLLDFPDLRIVSLGEDCFSRTVSTQWGLKKSARLGETTIPFDLSVHPLATLAHLLRADFNHYLDPRHLRYDPASKVCSNRFWRVTFNHEVGPDYAADGFARLIETYQRRVERFRDLLASDGLKVLMLHTRQPSPATPSAAAELLTVIRSRWPGRAFRLVNVQTYPFDRRDEVPADRVAGHGYAEINIAYPVPGYVWHEPNFCFSPAGHRFEQEVVDRVKGLLRTWLGQAPSSADGIRPALDAAA